MTTRYEKKAQLKAELARIDAEEKAKYNNAKAELMARHARHQDLLEADTVAAIAVIVQKGLFPVDNYCNKATVANNKDVNARRQTIIDLVRAGDRLGAMRALKKELDFAIEFAEQDERQGR